MRLALLLTVTIAAGLGACAPVPAGPYGYAPTAEPAGYGYYDGAYAPGPYYGEPAYAPGYIAPGPTIIVGGERRWGGDRDRDRYRFERQRNEGGFRGNPYSSPGRDFGRAPPPQNFGGGGRPGPSPVAVARPNPSPISPPPSGGAAFEQWNRTHVNASPSLSDGGGGPR